MSGCQSPDLHPNLWRPQRGDLAHHLFVAKGTHIVQSGVSPASIIETLDVIEGGASGLCSCLKRLAINAFPFETVKETFHSGIIVAIGSPAHACSYAFLLQECLIALARVGTPPIRVMEQPSFWTATSDGHL